MVDEWPYVIRPYLSVESWLFWGWQIQIGIASRPRRNKIGGVNEKSKDSFPLQASITKCQLFSFDAKIFVTCDAAYLSRNIYSRTVSVQKQGLHYSKDLFDWLFLSAGRASSPSLVHREKLKILPPSHKLKTEKTNTLIFVPLFYFSK